MPKNLFRGFCSFIFVVLQMCFNPYASLFAALCLCTIPRASFSLTLDDIYRDLKLHYPQYQGITFDKPSWNNTIEDDWLLQTPNIWNASLPIYNEGFIPKNGHVMDKDFFVPTCDTQYDCGGVSVCKTAHFTIKPKKLCLTKAHDVLESMYDAIVSANESVDIVTLEGLSFNAFRSAIRNAFYILSQKSLELNHPIIIRWLEGSFLPFGQALIKYNLNEILPFLKPNHKLVISIGDMRSCLLKNNCGNENDQSDLLLSFSWTHAKIINVDNNILITGGENFFGADYLERNPVNDSNIKVQGDVAKGARVYADILWKYINENKGLFSNYCRTYYNDKISNMCVTNMDTYITPQLKTQITEDRKTQIIKPVKAMYVSKLNNGVGIGDDADQSEAARLYAFTNAQTSIKISQQAFYMAATNSFVYNSYLHPFKMFDSNIIYAIAHAIYFNSVHVYIVLGNTMKGVITYSAGADLNYLYDCFLETLQKKFHLTQSDAIQKLNTYLHMGNLGYYPLIYSNNPKIMPFHKSHNKFWMIDDKIFYFGSHNFYPSSMQEFGVIIEAGEDVIQDLFQTFWNPMWYDAIKYIH